MGYTQYDRRKITRLPAKKQSNNTTLTSFKKTPRSAVSWLSCAFHVEPHLNSHSQAGNHHLSTHLAPKRPFKPTPGTALVQPSIEESAPARSESSLVALRAELVTHVTADQHTRGGGPWGRVIGKKIMLTNSLRSEMVDHDAILTRVAWLNMQILRGLQNWVCMFISACSELHCGSAVAMWDTSELKIRNHGVGAKYHEDPDRKIPFLLTVLETVHNELAILGIGTPSRSQPLRQHRLSL